ncbi:hypothetical protein GCM10020219_038400 [Nonomuraea dietziae]
MTLTADELEDLRGVDDPIDLAEVTDIYLPLTRLLNLHFTGSKQRSSVLSAFLGNDGERVPYILGIAGSVAVGRVDHGAAAQDPVDQVARAPETSR